MLNRPPSGDRDYPPERASLKTPPSSCTPPRDVENGLLMKPPTVPSQSAQLSPSPDFMLCDRLGDAFGVEEESMMQSFKMEGSPMICGGSLGAMGFSASGSFGIASPGVNLDAMQLDGIRMHHDQHMHHPYMLSSMQLGPSAADHVFHGSMLATSVDQGYDGDISLNDTSFGEYIYKLESPESAVGFDTSAFAQAAYPIGEPALGTGNSSAESSQATTEAWTPTPDPVGFNDAVMVYSGSGSDGDTFCNPHLPPLPQLTFTPPPLRPAPEFAFNQDRHQLATMPAVLDRPAAIMATLDPHKVSLYHDPQQNSAATIPNVLPNSPNSPASSFDPRSSMTPEHIFAAAEPAVPATPVAVSTPVARTNARKSNTKAPIRIKIAARKPAAPKKRVTPAIAPRPLEAELSHDCADSGCTSEHVPNDVSSSIQYSQQQPQERFFPNFDAAIAATANSIAAVAEAATTTTNDQNPPARARAARKPAKPRAPKKPAAPKPKRTRSYKPSTKPKGPAIRYPCLHPGCNKTFSSPHNLNEHGQVHDPNREKEFKCPIAQCVAEEREYYFLRDLRRHNRKYHPDPVLNAWLEKYALEQMQLRAEAKAKARAEA
ncbi:conserved hypothetical protein (N-terminal fragment), partial [Sporisorium reilianum SRZ2]